MRFENKTGKTGRRVRVCGQKSAPPPRPKKKRGRKYKKSKSKCEHRRRPTDNRLLRFRRFSTRVDAFFAAQFSKIIRGRSVEIGVATRRSKSTRAWKSAPASHRARSAPWEAWNPRCRNPLDSIFSVRWEISSSDIMMIRWIRRHLRMRGRARATHTTTACAAGAPRASQCAGGRRAGS